MEAVWRLLNGCALGMLLLGSIALADPMTLTYSTALSTGKTITLPLYGMPLNVSVDWGDNSTNVYTSSGNQNHTYTTAGTYTVTINGTLPHFGDYTSTVPNADKLIAVVSFGDVGLRSLGGAFFGAKNLKTVPATLPSGIQDMSNMFNGASSFNSDISAWDVSSATDMHGMFYKATAFNGAIGSWDVSHVMDMGEMFKSASVFNADIGAWDVSSVTDMSEMFKSAPVFNGDLSAWDVSSVTDMSEMFYEATAFNGAIGSWDVSSVTNMDYMLAATKCFNQPIGSWNVSQVTSMKAMFYLAPAFNQALGNWDVSHVGNMSELFSGASSFDQNLGAWNVVKVTEMIYMFDGVTLSVANYDALLNGWSKLKLWKKVAFSGGGSKYSATAARTLLTGTYAWTITDGGVAEIQTLTALADMVKTYGNADFSQVVTASSGLDVSYRSSNPNVATFANGNVHIVGAGTTIISAHQAGNQNIAPAQTTATLTVNPIELTLAATNERIVEGDTPTLAYTLTSGALLKSDKITGAPSVSALTVGQHPITQGSLDAGANYRILFESGMLTVEKALGVANAPTESELSIQWVRGGVQVQGYRGNAGVYTFSGQRVATLSVVADGFYALDLPIGQYRILKLNAL